MSFTIVIDAEAGRAKAEIAAVTAGLDKSSAAAQRTTAAMGQVGATGAQAGQQAAAGADRAADGHRRAKAAAEEHGGALEKLIHLAEAYFAVHQVEQLIDKYAEMANQLRAVSTSHENMLGLMDATFAVAQRARILWDDVTAAYQRLGIATRGLGISQQDTIQLTENMALSMKMGGASNREAGQAMMEFSHAFAGGNLQMREYRVLVRDVPAAMRALQEASGKSAHEFAEMGRAGKLTGQLIYDLYMKAGPALRDQFANTIPTISEGFVLIKNAAEKFFGEVAVGTGALSGFSSVLKFVADHFAAIGKIALGVGEALVGLFVIEKIIGLVKALTAAVAANPLGALLIVLVSGITLLRQFGDELSTTQHIWSNVEGQFVTVGDELRAVWKMMKELGAAVIDFVDNAWHHLTAAFGAGIDGKGLEFSLGNVMTFIGGWIDTVIGLFKFLGHELSSVFHYVFDPLIDVIKAVADAVIFLVKKAIDAYHAVKGLLPGGGDMEAEQDALVSKLKYRDWSKDLTTAAIQNNKTPAELGLPTRYTAHDPQGGAHEFGTREDARRAYPDDVPSELQVGQGSYTTLPVTPELRAFGEAQGITPPDKQTALSGLSDMAGFPSLKNKLTSDWRAAMDSTTTVTDLIKEFRSKMEADAHAIAAERVMSAQDKGAVGTDHGQMEAEHESDKASKAREKLANEFRAITEASNPVTAAQEKLAHATTVVDKAVTAGIATWQRGGEVMADYMRREQDALDPMGAWVRKQIEQTAALSADAREMERNAAMRKFLDEQKKQGTHGGLGADDAEIEQARHMIAYTQERTEVMRAEQAVFASVHGPARAYADAVKAIGELEQAGALTTKEYREQMDAARASYLSSSAEGKTTGGIQEAAWLSAKAAARSAGVEVEGYDQVLRKVRAQQLAAGPEGKTFLGGMEAGWIQLQQQAEAFGATVAGQVIGGIDKLNDTLVTAANTGSVSWSKMADSMLQDLERVALKAAEVRLIAALIPGGGGGESDVSSALANNGLLHFATGGSFMVGGSGGTDSQTVIFRASPDERVTVQTPTQQRDGGSGSRGPAPAAPVVNVHNHYDTDAFHAALTSRRGQQTLINTMRANKHLLR